jgi:hypothetical protein
MEDAKRLILEQVATGALTPQEAAERLQELEEPSPSAVVPVAVQSPPPGLKRVSVRCPAGKLTVIGDPNVREAVVDGPNRMRREGDTLRIDLDDLGSPGFTVVRGGGNWNFGIGKRALAVRMNPALALEFEAQAASVAVSGVTGPIEGTVQAGATRIDGFEGPLRLTAQAGSIRAAGRLRGGDSRINCEAGSVRLLLQKGSSVRVKATSTLGKVRLQSGREERDEWGLGGSQEAVYGSGEGLLEIVTSMGSVTVEEDR